MKIRKKSAQKQPMRYWLVEISLTSGKILTFYVKARTVFDAYEKADEYAVLAENEKLRNKLSTFKLMP